ncbi:MAG: response regulator [Janthinobacterium lividum]
MSATILVVDDDSESRLLLRKLVEAEGHSVRLAQSGAEALTMLDGFTPDLVLMDAIMPGLDGFDTCRRIKARADGANLPVIFMTGLTDTEDVVRGLRAGGVDYVTKPLVLDELFARIHVHLGNARIAREAMTALDTTGGRVLSTDARGRIAWATIHTRTLLSEVGAPGQEAVETLLNRMISMSRPGGAPELVDVGEVRLAIAYLGTDDGEAHLFSMTRNMEGNEVGTLQVVFGLTRREAEVLLWISRGKSNRDASEILNISARTVNKHLEQIFIKMGVENRAAAAAASTRVMLAQGM